ncbi:hypothetical protein [uncultured Flavobacterium sp.]|uniref:hypothetical protein n=1 Tax=uncultured Flavobacterium sp. TaxID=165435 RepID=UPI003081D46E
MNLFKWIIVFILFSSCKNNDEKKLLYSELDNYNKDLKTIIKSQESYFVSLSLENSFYKKRYDSLNKIELKLEDYFQRNRYKDRHKLIAIRDTFNNKFKLNLKLILPSNYKNISDSVFNKLIETEFLKMRLEFQSRYMFFHGDNFK